ncbi:hypothetical protein DFJ77DRAFT_118322 [Powellomyces hirtus]|nr:hypothetical protein DFJ77DRAFT_118322 [Powellomyces hirtus]
MLTQDVFLAALKIFWFSTSLSLTPPKGSVAPTPLRSVPLALRCVLLGWACASWSKSSLLIQGRGSGIASHGSDRERQVLATWHLAVAYTLVWTWPPTGRKKPATSAGPASAILVPPAPLPTPAGKAAPWTRIGAAMAGMTLVALLVDELAYLVLAHTILGPVVVTIRGESAPPPGTQTDDCMICLGVGLGDADAESPTDTTGHEPPPAPLESFCKIPTHVAHVDCMMKLYMMKRYGRKCPVCRRRLRVRAVDDRMIVKQMGWLRGVPWIVKREWNWDAVMSRSAVTGCCILGVVLSVVVTRAARFGRLKVVDGDIRL